MIGEVFILFLIFGLVGAIFYLFETNPKPKSYDEVLKEWKKAGIIK